MAPASLVLPAARHLASVERPEEVAYELLEHLATEAKALNDGRHERGMDVRREVLGDEHVGRRERTTDLTATSRI